MIKNISMSGLHGYELDEATKRYVRRKIGRLDRYLPRHARKTLHMEVKLKQVNRSHGNKYECDVILRAPHHTLAAKESTVNMLAAVDIVEEKIKNQLKKYKAESTSQRRGARRLLGRFRRNLSNNLENQ
jgi:putative sigma-54 modulation protein